MSLCGLDIGTTGCKITVYDNEGNYQFRAYRDYVVSRNGNEHEVDAANIWASVKAVIKEVTAKYKDIQAIGVTSFGETCVLLDETNYPIRPAMLYTDPRGSGECAELIEKLGIDKIRSITGINPHCMYSLPKIMWIKAHYSNDYAKARRICMMEDYIIYMLTGNAVIDYSLASRSMAFDIVNYCWSKELLEAAGIDGILLSKPVISGTIAGTVEIKMAIELSLNTNVIVVPVGQDQVAAAIGAGVFSSNCAVDGSGTVECETPVFDGIPENDKMYEGNYAIVPYVIPGKYVTYAFSFTGGALVQWYVDNLAKQEKAKAEQSGKSVYEILEEGMKDEPTGILVLPYFAGAATPYMDVGAKGAVLGLTLGHNASDLYRAMMEGVAYEMRLNMKRLQEAGIETKKLHATGGGAASKVWMQMKSDILNVPIVSLETTEAGAAGCVMMAGIAAGVFKDLESAAKAIIRIKDTYTPRKEMHEKYQLYYENYKQIYHAIRPLT